MSAPVHSQESQSTFKCQPGCTVIGGAALRVQDVRNKAIRHGLPSLSHLRCLHGGGDLNTPKDSSQNEDRAMVLSENFPSRSYFSSYIWKMRHSQYNDLMPLRQRDY